MGISRLNHPVKETSIPIGEPFAIAFSGGGDSTALVHMMRNRRPHPVVLIVDHALRTGSKSEAARAKAFSEGLGLESYVLTWDHDNPKTGIQEKARRGRYGLMGRFCRNRGIKYLLTAHTEDDQAETIYMRRERTGSYSGMSKLTFAPVWPELADVSIYRPCLGFSRKYLRDYNNKHGLSWIEDPSNENRQFERIKARDFLSTRPNLRNTLLSEAEIAKTRRDHAYRLFRSEVQAWTFGWAGEIICPRLPVPELLALAIRCVGGRSKDFSHRSLIKRHREMTNDESKGFTLGGAMVKSTGTNILICRDPVAVSGRADGNLEASAVPTVLGSEILIWDGRFAFHTLETSVTVSAQQNTNVPYSSELKARIAALHLDARPTAPILVRDEQAYHISELGNVTCRVLIRERLDKILSV